MPTIIHKVIISNASALKAKYGTAAFANVIQPAIQALITADAGRGLNTIECYVDDAAAMNAVGGQAVSVTANPQQNKDAVDSVFNHYQPDYVLILGSVDIIPHQDLVNPAFTPNDPNGDPDRLVPSDLPYACPGPYDTNTQKFLNPTRVVGRLPDITNGTDTKALVQALNTAAGFKSRPANTYRQYLGVTAGVWTGSTQLSLATAFGSATKLQIVPPKTYRWTKNQLALPSHFFNCHGDVASPQYFGQPASGAASYPPALDAAFIAGKIRRGTVAAAECCYGAELYDPAQAGGQHGIPNQYLIDGAYGFLGSTTIAYGPSTTNDWADIICQDFFNIILTGASLGRAVLQARQNYIAARAHLSAIDLKTLAQFFLLGDPAVQPVALAEPVLHAMIVRGKGFVEAPKDTAKALGRSERRATLTQNGLALANSVSLPAEATDPPPEIKRLLRSRLERTGVKEAAFMSYSIESPMHGQLRRGTASMKGSFKVPRATHLAIGRLPTPAPAKTPALAGIELVQYDNDVIEKPFRSR